MIAHCHRCGSTVDDEASFCPHCAAPQLQVAPPQEAAELDSGPIRPPAHHRRAIDWRRLIRLALLLAIPVGAIAPFFFFLPLVVAGPILLITLYQKGGRAMPLDGKAGFRIGTLMGVLTAYISAFGLSASELFERFWLHRGSAIDTQFTMELQQLTETSRQMAQANSLNAQQARAMLNFFLSPDGRVVYTFFNAALLAFGIVLLAGLGGVLGARLTRRSTSH
jgi:hypothetical protein